MRPGVYVTESVLATPVAVQAPAQAAGALLAPLPSGPTTPTLVTSWYQFTRLFGNLNSAYEATFAANLFFRAGGRELYVARVVKSDAVKASVNLLASNGTATWLTFRAKAVGTYGNGFRIAISKNANNLYDIQVLQEAGVSGDASDDSVLESYNNLDLATFGNAEIRDIFATQSQVVDVVWANSGTGLSVATTFSTLPLTGGTDGGAGLSFDYTGAVDKFRSIDRNFVMFAPGSTNLTLISAMVTFAEETGSFVVVDTEADATPAAAVTYAGTLDNSSYAAVYYPHLWVPDSTSKSRNAVKKVAPSGAVAGLILSTDVSQGVFKAPAGLQASIPGVVALERALTGSELDALNNNSTPVNAIRVVAGVGPVVMGARTLNQSASTRYVNIRRTLGFLDREIKSRLEFALFRNNDAALWSQMRTTLDAFLDGFWAAGGLRGNVRNDAYYVKIDRENNTAADIQNGIVNIEVGVALQYPAEFVKVKLTQQTLA